jgi:hypothetical protein
VVVEFNYGHDEFPLKCDSPTAQERRGIAVRGGDQTAEIALWPLEIGRTGQMKVAVE